MNTQFMAIDSKQSTRDYLQQRWRLTLTRLQTKPSLGARPFDEVLRRYSEETRHYHTTEHLRFGFQVLDEVFPSKEPNIGLIDLAFWYHDFVYDPKLHDNEVKSAFVAEDRALRGLGLSEQDSTKIALLIRDSEHKTPPKSREAEILLDIDLAILGATSEEFDHYENGIWSEYQQHVSLEDFRHARANILKRFNQGPVFWSPEMRGGVYERRAKVNLRRSIRQLNPKGA